MKKILSFIICSLLFTAAHAQVQKCGAQMLKESAISRNPGFAAYFDSFQADQEILVSAIGNGHTYGFAEKTTSASAIPVIFHIVLDSAQIAQLGGTAGIQERADSQIAVLNRDYNAGNGDAYLIPAGFQPLYGNAGIRFGLAHLTPQGNYCPGYEVITTTVTGFSYNGTVGSTSGFSNAKYHSSGGADIWDSSTYLNVWVINPTSPAGVLGLTVPKSYANAAAGFASVEEGVVLNYASFGTKSPNVTYFINSGAQGGRTLTHEIGHFFEIWHPSGDDNGLCPSDANGKDDGIADTPPEGNNHQGTYNIPLPVVTDNCTTSGNGIMYMNFMDYPDDPFALLFTKEQAQHIQANVAPGGESYSLTQHPGVLEVPSVTRNATHNITIWPTPTTGTVQINAGSNGKPQHITVVNILGQLVTDIIPSAKAPIYTIDMTGMQKGLYFVQCYFTDGMASGKIILQ